LVNGSTTKEFNPSKGIRQSDPMTLFIFIIAVEGLASIIRLTKMFGYLEGVKIGKRNS